MNKRLYMRQWLLALDRFELRLRTKVAQERNRFIRTAAKIYDTTGAVPAYVVTQHEDRLAGLLLAHYQVVMPYFGTLATQSVKSRHRVISRKNRSTFFVRMMEWATTRALNNAATIADTDFSDIRAAITQGIEEGLGVAEVARSIRGITGDTVWRAATVARTETHAAATYGVIEEARQTSDEIGIVLVKEWLPTSDERTRPEHAALSGSAPIPLDAQFLVGGELLDRPGDPSGSAENIINCRCAIITEEAAS